MGWELHHNKLMIFYCVRCGKKLSVPFFIDIDWPEPKAHCRDCAYTKPFIGYNRLLYNIQRVVIKQEVTEHDRFEQ